MQKFAIGVMASLIVAGAAIAGQPEGTGNGKGTAAEASTGAAGNGIVGHGPEPAESGVGFGEAASGLGKSGEMGGHASMAADK